MNAGLPAVRAYAAGNVPKAKERATKVLAKTTSNKEGAAMARYCARAVLAALSFDEGVKRPEVLDAMRAELLTAFPRRSVILMKTEDRLAQVLYDDGLIHGALLAYEDLLARQSALSIGRRSTPGDEVWQSRVTECMAKIKRHSA
jgi:hypothetical protein